jgi:hypothetical protein
MVFVASPTSKSPRIAVHPNGAAKTSRSSDRGTRLMGIVMAIDEHSRTRTALVLSVSSEEEG